MTSAELTVLAQQQKDRKATPEYQTDRATYLHARETELDRIRALDADYRSQLRSQPQDPGDRYAAAGEDEWRGHQLQADAAFELGTSYRVLVHAVEGFLLTCMEVSYMTGEKMLGQVSSTDELVAKLQHEEDTLNASFGQHDGRPGAS